MTRIPLFFLLVVLIGCSPDPTKRGPEEVKGVDLVTLSNNFVNPPSSSRPGAYWAWLNGDVTKASITADLEEMKAKGMGRAEIWDVEARNNTDGAFGIGPPFLGDESVDLIKHALSEGKRLGIRMGMVTSSGWNAGGSWVTPDWAAKALYSSELKVSGPQAISVGLPFPELPPNCPTDEIGDPVYSKEVAVLAIPDHPDKKINDLSDIVILNDRFDGEKLTWDVPEGDWTILRFVSLNTGQHLIVPSPNSDGLFIDFFDPDATKRHLAHILERLGITRENAAESGLGYLEVDSMELDEATPWTDAMDSIFYAHHNYNIERFLPAFSGWELPEGNDAFLYDFRKTVSDQLIFSHYTTGRDFLAEYGIDFVGEAGGPGPPVWDSCPVDALKALGNVTIPRGEFWILNRHNIFLVKEIASAAHIYGLESVDAESFTTWRRWKDAPHALKKHVDRAFAEGLNTVTFHTFANTRPEFGVPGRAYHAGADINPTTTWWEQAKPFNDYLARSSYLLTQGLFVADVAYYYGDKAPNFFPAYQADPDRPRIEGLSAGYDFDVVNTDVILNRMDVSDGKIMLPDGMSYKLLVLPDIEDIPDTIVRKVEAMVEAGANVLIQRPDIAKSLPGAILSDANIDDALATLSIEADFIGDEEKLEYIHRETGEIDLYFVRNKTDQPITETVSFRMSDKQAEFWDPVSAQQFRISSVAGNDGRTALQLSLPAYGSGFLVFTKEIRKLPEYERSGNAISTEIQGPWTLSFPENWGAPSIVELDELISWTDHDLPGVNYFSGTATYSNTFTISNKAMETPGDIDLNLGEVRDVAEVIVNGHSAGIVWTQPFELNIRDYVQEGENQLEVRVTNMWINRLTGDIDLPEGQKFTHTNRPPILEPYSDIGDETYRMQPSGLLGPVTWRIQTE